MTEPFDIIILAGQSNAVGHGCGETDYQFRHLSDVWLLDDEQPEGYTRNQNDEEILIIQEPWKIRMRSAENIDVKSLAGRFADSYIESGNLQPRRKILIVCCAAGGTGFCKKQWGIGNLLYRRMIDLTDYARKLHPENKIVAFLWHQGECDAFENPDWSAEMRYQTYYRDLKEQVLSVRERYHEPQLPFLCGGFTEDWAKDNREPCNAIYKANKQICQEIGNAQFIESTGLLSNNEILGNGDSTHFCKQATLELGYRYFRAYAEMMSL